MKLLIFLFWDGKIIFLVESKINWYRSKLILVLYFENVIKIKINDRSNDFYYYTVKLFNFKRQDLRTTLFL